MVILCVGIVADREYTRIESEHLRLEVARDLGIVRAKLEGNIGANMRLIGGLVAAVAAKPNMSEAEFVAFAKYLLPQQQTKVRLITVSRGMVNRMVYPLEFRKDVVGLDLQADPVRRAAALRARETGRPVLAGPTDQPHSGAAFMARYPIILDDGKDGQIFWGFVSEIIDAEDLYAASGLNSKSIDVAIVGQDGLGHEGAQFYGASDIITDNPVIADVAFLGGAWKIYARPKQGWNEVPPGVWLLRLSILLAGSLIVIPTLISGHLSEARRRYMTTLQQREAELRILSHRLDIALDASRIGVWEYAVNGELIWDDRMNEIFDYPEGKGSREAEFWNRVHPDDFERVQAEIRDAMANGTEFRSEFRIVHGNGYVRHIRAIAAAESNRGKVVKLTGINEDVTADILLQRDLMHSNELLEARNVELQAAHSQIRFDAMHDALTGLPSRRFIKEVLASEAGRAAGERRRLGVMHIDLHRFKLINETLGYAAGDAMLRHVARTLRDGLLENEFVGRTAADEFILLCTSPWMEARSWRRWLAGRASKIVEILRQPVDCEGHSCRIDVSIGIASEFEPDSDAQHMLIDADIALNRTKSRVGEAYQFFTSELQAEVVATKQLADGILLGIERNEFIPYYQPQFDASFSRVVGVEALARWAHPVSGLLAPGSFMRVAEDLNVVSTIDRQILEQALAHLKGWEASGLPISKASVNISARRLRYPGLIASLRKQKIPRGTISFELLESIFLDDNDDLVARNAERIKELGIDIEIDDFGTGYASILSLMKIRPARLKIARPLVAGVVESQQQRALVKSIVDIGRSLSIEVLAEGVETMQHAQILKDLGCSAFQGFALAKPMSEADLRDFVRSGQLKMAS